MMFSSLFFCSTPFLLAVSLPTQRQRPASFARPQISAVAATRPVVMTAEDSARHLLERLAWGPAPGQVEAVINEGILHWVDRQLGYPDARDPALESRERAFAVLGLPLSTLYKTYRDENESRRQLVVITDSSQREKARLEAQRSRALKGINAFTNQLLAVNVIRSVESEHQPADVLTEFWFNHFNVYSGKGAIKAFLPSYLEETIRPHILGKFSDLLLATARSPAMLFYLDNFQSVAPLSERAPAGRGRGRAAISGRGNSAQMERAALAGINENYARELMELHTLGVDGGYSQQDVIEVARILTGWGINTADTSGQFRFLPAVHARGSKKVMGITFIENGEQEGNALLQMLARNPATMHHVSAQLCARLVADDPPDGCVDEAVRVWKESDGEIRKVVRAIILSPDFWAQTNILNKIKTPHGFVISAIRALGAVPDSTPRIATQIARLGQPIFGRETPDGYPESQEDWVNSGALLGRMNFAVALAANRIPGVTTDLDRIIPLAQARNQQTLVNLLDQKILGGTMSSNTRKTILAQISDQPTPRAARALAIGLALGSPEFQRR